MEGRQLGTTVVLRAGSFICYRGDEALRAQEARDRLSIDRPRFKLQCDPFRDSDPGMANRHLPRSVSSFQNGLD